MNRSFWHRRVPLLWVAFPVLGAFAAAGVSSVLFLSRPNEFAVDPDSARPPGRAVLSPGSYPASPLTVGTASPEFEAAGWMNGEPPLPASPGHRLIVLDIWANW
jgi:hypothetical protein